MTFFEYLQIAIYGMATGFVIGFMSWAIGFVIYGIVKIFKS